MKLDLETDFLRPLAVKFEAAGRADLAEAIHKADKQFGAQTIRIDTDKYGLEGLAILYEHAQAMTNRSVMMHVSALRNVLQDPNKAKVVQIAALEDAIVAWLTTNAMDGWIYRKKGNLYDPYAVKAIEYHIPYNRRDKEDRPYVTVSLIANTIEEGRRSDHASLTFYADGLAKKTVPELFADNGYFHETPELRAQYDAAMDLFGQYRPMANEQFLMSGEALVEDDHRGWRMRMVDLAEAGATKVVNDESIVKRQFQEAYDDKYWQSKDVTTFGAAPTHAYIYVFNLKLHTYTWAHATQLTPYVYQPELRDKIVLPQEHRDLIDLLATDLDVLQEDVIEGKSGGTKILSVGEPGTGKTLTAEIYAEVIGRPLYSIHSGQLGTDPDSVRKNLETILKRAQRWGAVALIDEADLYVRKRGNDLDHNAIVAEFLRTLEYHEGLLFLTTNRADDVDDAIESRCVAIIHYQRPGPKEAAQIWRIQAEQIGLALPEALVQDLVNHYTYHNLLDTTSSSGKLRDDRVSGRDIRQLLRLAAKFVRRRQRPLDIELFRQIAQFRRL